MQRWAFLLTSKTQTVAAFRLKLQAPNQVSRLSLVVRHVICFCGQEPRCRPTEACLYLRGFILLNYFSAFNKDFFLSRTMSTGHDTPLLGFVEQNLVKNVWHTMKTAICR